MPQEMRIDPGGAFLERRDDDPTPERDARGQPRKRVRGKRFGLQTLRRAIQLEYRAQSVRCIPHGARLPHPCIMPAASCGRDHSR